LSTQQGFDPGSNPGQGVRAKRERYWTAQKPKDFVVGQGVQRLFGSNIKKLGPVAQPG